MARTIAEIKKEITDRFISYPFIISVYGLDSTKTFEQQFSVETIESILFYCIAVCIWTLEKLFDIHKSEVKIMIDNMKPHSLLWWANLAKSFQYGDNLIPDTDQYNNVGKTPEEIAESKIVAYSAVADRGKEGLIIKVAKDNGTDLEPLSNPELSAFKEYMKRVSDAGVHYSIISKEADDLKLQLRIHYNPLVLNAQGQRLDGQTLTPVADAVRLFLKNLPFNGLFVNAYLTDALQQVEGIVIPTIELAQAKYGDLDWLNINVMYQPYAGYLRITDENLIISYEPHSEIA